LDIKKERSDDLGYKVVSSTTTKLTCLPWGAPWARLGKGEEILVGRQRDTKGKCYT